MKKMILMALAITASALFNGAAAQKKRSKKNTVTTPKVTITTSSDSLSYAAGIAITNGLDTYLKQQFGVDSTDMEQFMRGFKEALSSQNDRNFKAYAAGISIAQQLTDRMLPSMKADFTDTPDSLNQQLATEGFMAALMKDTTVMTSPQAEEIFTSKRAANKAAKEEKLYGANRKAGEDFLAENSKKEGVVTLPSGLQYKVLTKGTGEIPKATDKVQVHYEGTLVDGTVFDASKKHGDKPLTFAANQVIKGWTEALCLMPVGSKWELYIPYQLAYGERDMGTIKPYSALIFTVELLGIEK
ncbi:MAG: FKBP-type peptidyl-prolyl cis-trans isomerase [Prevotella sp.]